MIYIYIKVPPGTIVRDQDGLLAGELNQPGQRLLVARGGRGGRGNEYFKTARMNAPTFCEKGEPGVERWINIELKLVADVGFIGVPNAGKSTLLAASTYVYCINIQYIYMIILISFILHHCIIYSLYVFAI